MPQIIVTAGPTGQQGSDIILLRERVNPADFESERFAANLVERLGWAVSDGRPSRRFGDDVLDSSVGSRRYRRGSLTWLSWTA